MRWEPPPHYRSRNHRGRWGTTDDFTTSFLHFSLFSTALWDLASTRPVHSLMLSSHLFFCLPCLLLPFVGNRPHQISNTSEQNKHLPSRSKLCTGNRPHEVSSHTREENKRFPFVYHFTSSATWALDEETAQQASNIRRHNKHFQWQRNRSFNNV